MLVPAGSPIFFLRENSFAVHCRVVTFDRGTCSWTDGHCLRCYSCWVCVYCTYFLYIFFINIGCATLYQLFMMYVTVYNMSFNSNCRILAPELNYRFTLNCFFSVERSQAYSFLQVLVLKWVFIQNFIIYSVYINDNIRVLTNCYLQKRGAVIAMFTFHPSGTVLPSTPKDSIKGHSIPFQWQ